MEKNPNRERSNIIREHVLTELAKGNKTASDIMKKGRQEFPEIGVGPLLVSKNILELSNEGLVESMGKTLNERSRSVSVFRLTDQGAEEARVREIIDELQMLRLIHEREQNPIK
ncbi:hypothetical protein BH09PAT1_BH09PAT1_3810 [soil metagenome]